MDYVVIGGLLYLANVMNIYFPKGKEIKREKDENEVYNENRYEVKNILNNTLCNYLESYESISQNLNVKYFEDQFDKERAQKFNKYISIVRQNLKKLKKNKNRMFNYFKKSEDKNTDNISFPALEDKLFKVLKELKQRQSLEEGDVTITLDNIYRLYIDYDFYTLNTRDNNLDIQFDLFKDELLPNKFNVNRKGVDIKLNEEHINDIIKHLLVIEYIKEKIHRDDNDMSEMILLVSLWKFCLFFKDVLKDINITPDEKVCMVNIAETHFEVFYNKTKNKEGKKNICNYEKLRNKLCSDIIEDIVDKVTNNRLLNFRLVDFFENESINEVTKDDLIFDMII
jgi:hypothetical protein